MVTGTYTLCPPAPIWPPTSLIHFCLCLSMSGNDISFWPLHFSVNRLGSVYVWVSEWVCSDIAACFLLSIMDVTINALNIRKLRWYHLLWLTSGYKYTHQTSGWGEFCARAKRKMCKCTFDKVRGWVICLKRFYNLPSFPHKKNSGKIIPEF